MAAKNKPKTNTIDITRIYDAPVKMVWDAWNDLQQVGQWWGPRGFTITTHGKELKTGGFWKYTMHGPDGVNYENTTKYLEVVPYARMVYDHGGSEDRPPLFRVTVNFTDLKGKTKMDMSMALESVEAAEQTRKFIKQASGNSTWDRLDEYLEKNSTGKEKFVINRTFDAPIELMYDLWTNPDHFQKWLPPTGMTMKFIRADIKPGGKTFYVMSNGADVTMYGRTHYLNFEKPHRIQYTQEFCDEKENLSRHPMAPTWPATMLTTVTLAEEGPDCTRVTINWEAYGDVTPEELATFVKARGGMTQGWTGSFDKLENYIESL